MPATTPSVSHRRAGVVEGAEEEGVHEGDGPGPHGEDVAQDAAHPGGGPLVGLDGRRVVVALDPQRHGDAVAGVDDPGVLSRADQDMGPLGGEPFEVQPGRLVGAVLAPHHRVHGQLEVVGRAPEDLLDARRLVVGQARAPGAAPSPSPYPAPCRGPAFGPPPWTGGGGPRPVGANGRRRHCEMDVSPIGCIAPSRIPIITPMADPGTRAQPTTHVEHPQGGPGPGPRGGPGRAPLSRGHRAATGPSGAQAQPRVASANA